MILLEPPKNNKIKSYRSIVNLLHDFHLKTSSPFISLHLSISGLVSLRVTHYGIYTNDAMLIRLRVKVLLGKSKNVMLKYTHF